MNKQNVFNHYSSVIDNLINLSPFFSAYFQRPYYLESGQVRDYSNKMPLNVDIMGGATRICIIDSNYDYVVKIDIDEDYFGEACPRELKIYRAAREANLEKYFVEVEFLGFYTRTIDFYDIDDIEHEITWYDCDIEGFEEDFTKNECKLGEKRTITLSIPLYGYKKVSVYHMTKFSKEQLNYVQDVDKMQEVRSPLGERNLSIAASFIQDYGEDEYARLSNFAVFQHINDIHGGNIGDANGKICLIDYAGYHSSDDYYPRSSEEY